MNNVKMLYYNIITDISEGTDFNKNVHQKSVMFVTTSIFPTKSLSFNHIYAIDAIIY